MTGKVSFLSRTALAAFLLIGSVAPSMVAAAEPGQFFVERLEHDLNNGLIDHFQGLRGKDSGNKSLMMYKRFLQRFPDAKWKVLGLKPGKKNELIADIFVSGTQRLKSRDYFLESYQQRVLFLDNKLIKNHMLISEESILKTNKQDLPITLQIPDEVLTGSRYDLDVIFDNPLGDNLLAGGVVPLENIDFKKDAYSSINIVPLPGGGLFKSVQAPYTPGEQAWGIILVHSKGLITVTKRVRVVDEKDQLRL